MDGEGVVQFHWFNTIVNLPMIDGYVDFLVLFQDFIWKHLIRKLAHLAQVRLIVKKILPLHEEIIMGVISVIQRDGKVWATLNSLLEPCFCCGLSLLR